MTHNDNEKKAVDETAVAETDHRYEIYSPAQSSLPHQWPRSFEIATPKGQRLLTVLTSPAQRRLSRGFGGEHYLVGYLIWPRQTIDDETGETHDVVETTLLLSDDTTVGSTGSLVLRKLALIVAMRGTPSSENPIRVRLFQAKSLRGRMYDDMQLAAIDSDDE